MGQKSKTAVVPESKEERGQMNKKLQEEIKKHKVLTRIIADGTYTLENNEKALHCQQITGQRIALVLADFKCENVDCKSEKDLSIHHLITKVNKFFVPFNKYWSQRRYFFNICILCLTCHIKLHKYSQYKSKPIDQTKIDKLKEQFKD